MWKFAAFAAFLAVALAVSSITLVASRDGSGQPSIANAAVYTVGMNTNPQLDPSGHAPFIQMPEKQELKVVVQFPDFITITGPQGSPFVPVTGVMEGNGFSATGSGTIVGIPNVQVAFDGTFGPQGMSGQYSMGTDGDLPPGQGQGQPITYIVKPQGVRTPTPAATATPTPPGKLYSITVLKLDEDTKEPLSGWEFNLYAGDGCSGQPLAQGITFFDGIYDFVGLIPGDYSVEEKLVPGWNNVTPICQDVTLGGAGGTVAGLPPCPVQPDQDFPAPGCDSFVSGARVIVRLNGSDITFPVTLNGPTLIARSNAPADHDGDGLDDIDTEIVAMELTGSGMTVRESPTLESNGQVEEQQNEESGVMDFPARSFFDVFFEVDMPGGQTLHNEVAFHIECKIDEIPPYQCLYQPPIPQPIVLYDENDVKFATIEHALHIPLPPNEVLVVFTNREKTTPTVSPTPTRTNTPPPGVTPSPTPTRTKVPANGECEKTGQDIPFQNSVWDRWKCYPNNTAIPYSRVDISIGKATQDPKLDPEFPPRFVCQATSQKTIGAYKGHKKDVNPGTSLPDHEVWAAQFPQKCTGGVDVYVRPLNPGNHPVIQKVAFSNPTLTPTPPKTYSITVLKRNARNHLPLAGWTMNLYSGAGCSGAPIDSGVTGSNGIIDFIDLTPGDYSVRETLQPGWNPVTPLCQNLEVGGGAGSAAGFIACPIPDVPFPGAGCDQFDSGAQVNLDLNLDGLPDQTVNLNGPTTVRRSSYSPGTMTIDTEILQLDLVGSSPSPIQVHQSSARPSVGKIEDITTGGGGAFVSGDSFFDIFFEVEIAGGPTLHNEMPLRMECHVTQLPPLLCLYQPPIPAPIPLLDPNGTLIAYVVHGLHIPLPENELLIVFDNVRKPNGDVSCDGRTNSLDGLFILQYVARLLLILPCGDNADVNLDNMTNALDSALVLQFDAGLLATLPPQGAGGTRGWLAWPPRFLGE